MKKTFIISLFVLIIDIISKQLVSHFLAEGECIVIIPKFFSLTFAKNTGVAFSMLEGMNVFIIIVTIIVILCIIRYILNSSYLFYEVVGYSFIIGGAMGNLIDRIIYGYVIDFLDFNIFGYDFPVFNIADSAIVIGVILIVIFSFKKGDVKNEINSRCKREN